jgi:hypothetical protein
LQIYGDKKCIPSGYGVLRNPSPRAFFLKGKKGKSFIESYYYKNILDIEKYSLAQERSLKRYERWTFI